jgi:hypothetical protein
LNLGLLSGALLLEPDLQSILLWVFWRWGFELLGQIHLRVSQVARITNVSHQCSATSDFLERNFTISNSGKPRKKATLSH